MKMEKIFRLAWHEAIRREEREHDFFIKHPYSPISKQRLEKLRGETAELSKLIRGLEKC